MTRAEAIAAIREGRADVPPDVLSKYRRLRDLYASSYNHPLDRAEAKALEMMLCSDWARKRIRDLHDVGG